MNKQRLWENALPFGFAQMNIFTTFAGSGGIFPSWPVIMLLMSSVAIMVAECPSVKISHINHIRCTWQNPEIRIWILQENLDGPLIAYLSTISSIDTP